MAHHAAVPLTPLVAAVLLVTVVAGLAVDRALDPWLGHVWVSAWVWGVWIWLAARATPEGRATLLRCLVLATAGELVLATLWGLYDYRLGALPGYVPPGHVLMLMLGLMLARHLTPGAAARLAGTTVALMLVAVLWTGDAFSLPLLALFAGLWWAFPAQRPVFASMLVLALALELYGTALGSWRWRETAPGLGLAMHNPPWAASVFYCVLDCLVLRWSRYMRPRSASDSALPGATIRWSWTRTSTRARAVLRVWVRASSAREG